MATKKQKGKDEQLKQAAEQKVDEVEDGQLIRMAHGGYSNEEGLKGAHVTALADTFRNSISFVRGAVGLVGRVASSDDPGLGYYPDSAFYIGFERLLKHVQRDVRVAMGRQADGG